MTIQFFNVEEACNCPMCQNEEPFHERADQWQAYFEKISRVKPSNAEGSHGSPAGRHRSPARRFNVGIETKGS